MNIALALVYLKDNQMPADQAIDQIYSLYEHAAGVQGCTAQSADEFVRYFYARVKGEGKELEVKEARLEALRAIRAFIAVGQGMCSAFPLVDRYRFAVELALRVRRPRTIAQNYANGSGGVNLCGPNMMIIDFAKREPLEFARYALGLAEQGTATLWRTTVRPDPQFRTVTPPARLAPVDFVLLGSLRYTDEHYYELLDTIKSLTKPGLLTTWLQQAGFTQVRDQTLPVLGVVASVLDALTPHSLNTYRGTTGLHRGLQSLQNATLELAEGRLVIMLGSVVLAGMMTKMGEQFRTTGATMALHTPMMNRPSGLIPDLHWMLVKKLTANSGTVTLHLYTYGRSVSNTFNTGDFLAFYNGYVSAAHPPAPAVNVPLLTYAPTHT